MVNLTLRIQDSLSHLSDEALDALTAKANVFFGRRWLRMLESLDLSWMARGTLSLRYVVVSDGQAPVALCPFISTRSKSIYFHYSLEKFFFTAWRGEFERLNPANARWGQQVFTLVNLYRRLVWAAGAGVDGCMMAASPLSTRGGIVCAPMPTDVVRRARRMIIEALRGLAGEERLPLCFYGVEQDDAELRQVLADAAFHEFFLFHDNLIELTGQSLEDYLGRFRSDVRRRFKREMARVQEVGLRLERTSGIGALGDHMEHLYEATYSRYGDDHFRHPAWFWKSLERYLSPEAEAVVAFQGATPVGFSLLLHKGEDLWFYRVGRRYEEAQADASLYFNLAFYEPIQRAFQVGARRLWLGPSAYETKRRRGARRHALYSYIWLPRRRSRALLLPYVSVFSSLSRKQMDTAGGISSREGFSA
jgi:predicted N-acyltransferase